MQLTALVLIVCFVIIDHESVVLKSEFEEFLSKCAYIKTERFRYPAIFNADIKLTPQH